MASNERYYVNEYIKLKQQIDDFESRGDGESKELPQNPCPCYSALETR